MQLLQYTKRNSDLIAQGLWAVGAGQMPERRRETVIRSGESEPSIEFPVLWYRYRVATWYLELEGWTELEIFPTALGIDGDDPSVIDSGFASVAQAIIDLSLVDATVQSRGPVLMGRRHEDFHVAAIGIIERLSWDFGTRTDRGCDIDANIQGMFRMDRRRAS